MSGEITIDVNDTAVMEQIFEELPRRYQKKVILNTFRKAASPMRSAMRRSLPSKLRKFAGRVLQAKAGKSTSQPSLTLGFFGRVGGYASGNRKVVDIYSIIYWSNYGTLSRRTPSHRFENPRKSRTSGWKGGISPGLFVEAAVRSTQSKSEEIAYSEFNSELDKVIQKYKS